MVVWFMVILLFERGHLAQITKIYIGSIVENMYQERRMLATLARVPNTSYTTIYIRLIGKEKHE